MTTIHTREKEESVASYGVVHFYGVSPFSDKLRFEIKLSISIDAMNAIGRGALQSENKEVSEMITDMIQQARMALAGTTLALDRLR